MFDTLFLAATLGALAAGLGAGAIGVVLGAVADDAFARRAARADGDETEPR
jgi:uncharacterized membrane protein